MDATGPGRLGRVTLVLMALALLGASGVWVVDSMGDAQERSRFTAQGQERAPVTAEKLGELPDELRESSGLAVSRTYPGTFWSHNDSGDRPRIYAIDARARLTATFNVQGAEAQDWESMDLGACPDGRAGSCLYIGDTGDNDRQRGHVTLYVVPEPDPGRRGGEVETLGRVRLRYRDGPHDVEAMAVAPDGEVILVTKGRTPRILLYRIPPADVRSAIESDSILTLGAARILPIRPDWNLRRTVTGASVNADGSRLAVRTYTEIFFFPWPPPSDVPLLSTCFLGDLDQGEGVAFEASGSLLLTSEDQAGRQGVLTRVECGS